MFGSRAFLSPDQHYITLHYIEITTNYAKNYCNRTLIVKVIVENVVTCFFGTRRI